MSLPLRESYAIKALMPFVISPLALTNYHTLGQLALFLIFPVQICFSASNRASDRYLWYSQCKNYNIGPLPSISLSPLLSVTVIW